MPYVTDTGYGTTTLTPPPQGRIILHSLMTPCSFHRHSSSSNKMVEPHPMTVHL